MDNNLNSTTDATQKYNFQDVIEVLQDEGQSEEDIAQILEDLTKTASSKFYAEAMATFSDEELAQIESLSDEEANNFIAQKYQEKTGQDPKVAMDEFLNTFAKGFIEQYIQDQQKPTA